MTRPCRVVATAGHVDHGKSSLVRALTGTDPDRWAEEKARGLTIDLGFAHTILDSGTELSFVDVPGHVRFLPNMLAGVGGVAACLFVVAATEGWKPQSEEHLRILELAGIRSGVVALTKVDGLSREDVDFARLQLEEAVAGSFLAGAPIVEVSAPTGLGMESLRRTLDSVLTYLEEAPDIDRPRLWVDRAFSAVGAGTVVTGTLAGGCLRVNDQLALSPGGALVRVRGLQTHGRSEEEVSPGRRVAVNLAGVPVAEVHRGQALVRPEQWVSTARFDVELKVLDGLDHPVARRGAYVLHAGTHAGPVRLQLLGERPEALPGEQIAARLRLSRPLPLMPGDRFVLRESGRDETVGGGEVLDVDPVLRPRRARPDRSVERVVAERGWVESDLLERLTGVRRPPDVGRWVVDDRTRRRAIDHLRARIREAGPHGLAVSALDDRQRALVASLSELEVAGDHIREAGQVPNDDPRTAEWLSSIESDLFRPAPPDGIDRRTLRPLLQQGRIIESDGFYFSARAVEQAAALIGRLLEVAPDGVTASAIREALGTSRKFALPLLGHLDASGFTRRRGDLRIAGPRLSGVEQR